MVCPPDGFQILSESWYNRDYDVIEVPIRPNDIVIDIGANNGYFSCYVAQKGAIVLAIEPSASNLEVLQTNISLNKFDKQITVIPFAVAQNEGFTALFKIERYAGALYTTNPIYARSNSGKEIKFLNTERVRTKSINEILQLAGNNRIRMLKLDCEGAEWEILESLDFQLANKIDCIVIEYHHVYHLKELYNMIDKLGCFEISLANQLPWAARQIIKLVHIKVWKEISNYHYS